MAPARLLTVASVLFLSLVAPTQLLAQGTDASGAAAPPEDPAGAPTEPSAAEPAPGPAAVAAGASSAATETTTGGAGEGRAAANTSATKTVSVGDNFYSPKTITVAVGDKVEWVNNGQAPHSATADDDSFDTGVFNPGQSRSQRFDSPGTINYYCTVHGQSQSGTIKVRAASTGGVSAGEKSGSASDTAGSGAGQSEAAATAASDAAGNDSKLPATGSDPWSLAIAGLMLLTAGLIAARRRPG